MADQLTYLVTKAGEKVSIKKEYLLIHCEEDEAELSVFAFMSTMNLINAYITLGEKITELMDEQTLKAIQDGSFKSYVEQARNALRRVH